MKKYFLSYLITLLSIIITIIIITTFYYFNIINQPTYNILKIIFFLLSLFINSFILGKNKDKKGYLEGIKLSLPIIFIFLLTSLIKQKFKLSLLIYYLIIMITTSLGGMIGISTKKEL